MTEILERVIEAERRRQFFEDVNASYATLRADPKAWDEWQAELDSMDGSIGDGLEEE